MDKLRIIIGGDHAGYFLKEHLKKYLVRKELNFIDVGPARAKAVDYPDFAEKVAEAVSSGQYDRGILICGSGIGVAIAANKIPGIRAAVCNDVISTKLSREHNDTNILALGARMITEAQAEEIVDIWLQTDFVREDRHIRRVQKITQIEKKYLKDDRI